MTQDILCWSCFKTFPDSEVIEYISGYGYGICRKCFEEYGRRIYFNPYREHHCSDLRCIFSQKLIDTPFVDLPVVKINDSYYVR